MVRDALCFFFSSRRRHTRFDCDWSSDVCSSDLKSDREGAERVEREIRALQSLAVRGDNWTPPIVKTVATDGTGIPELAAAIRDYQTHLQRENLLLKRNIQNWQARLVEMLRDAMLEKARDQLGEGEMAQYAAEVAEHKRDPYTLVEEIVQGRRH